MQSLKRNLPRTLFAALCAATVLVGLSACGKKEGIATQVAARVNQGEISVHQVNLALQRQPDVPVEQAQAAGRAALERLIQIELAVQKANENKIDRDPQVVQAVDLARREVLARAYIDRLAESVARPSAQDIDNFYAAQPALFKDRKLYSVQEIGIALAGAPLQDLQAKLQSARTGPAMLTELASSGLAFSASTVTRPAEDWPLPVLNSLKNLGRGEALFVPQANGLRVLLLRDATPAPRSLEQARPAIEQYLINQNKQKQVDADLAAMRAAATVKYMGKFAEAGASVTSVIPVRVEAVLSGAASAAPAASASSVELDAAALSKGISGLK